VALRWCIYYGDGSIYAGSTDEEAYNAKAYDVQVIVIENPDRAEGFGIVTGRDAYLYKNGRFWGCDEAGVFDYLYHHPGPKQIVFGTTIDSDTYNATVARALREGLGG
jgi:hypothetical protein